MAGLTDNEITIADAIALDMLDASLGYNEEGKIAFSIRDTDIVFKHSSDAEALEKIALLWLRMRHTMDSLVADLVSEWIKVNKETFN
jgi:2C-methyl-D-erythritol 2,4-cyclodiphosphate synthase